MAKLIAPLHSSEARGRVGGLIYNTYRGLATCKSKTGPAQPRSSLQLQLRAMGVYWSRKWQSLSAGVRGAWNDYAAAHTEIDWTGNPKRLTGLNWYLRCNIIAQRLAGGPLTNPPSVPAPAAAADVVGTGGVGEIVVTWTDTAEANTYIDAWVSGPHSAGQIARMPRSRHDSYTAMATETVTIGLYGTGVVDVWVRTVSSATGLASPWQLVSDTIT